MEGNFLCIGGIYFDDDIIILGLCDFDILMS